MTSLQRALLTIGIGAIAAGVATIALFAQDGAAGTLLGVVYMLPVWTFTGCGIWAWLRRPHNRFGALMVAAGAACLAAAQSGTEVPALEAIGVLMARLPIALIVHVLLAFPSGRVARADRPLLIAVYVAALVVELPRVLFGDEDVLRIESLPDVADAAAVVQVIVGYAVVLAAVVALVFRLLRATPSQRRGLAPIWLGGSVVLLALVGLGGALVELAGPSDLGETVAQSLAPVIASLLPFTFVATLARGGFARAGEVSELAARLDESVDQAGSLRDACAAALGDPSLALVYWAPAIGSFVDERGEPVAEAETQDGRGVFEVTHDGQRVGAIRYDRALIADTEVVAELARVAGLAMDHQRLTADLAVRARELSASRERLVTTADAERRRIARDVHDGAQQRLVLLKMQAGMLGRAGGDPERVGQLAAEMGEGLDTAITELRDLVHGLMPALLAERGLFDAVEWLANRHPLPVRVERSGDRDGLSPLVESTAYFVIAEGLTNVAKYARAHDVSIVMTRTAELLTIEVHDDGIGGADRRDGSGLRGLSDRVEALGGSIAVHSPPGEGTVVRAELPCAL